MENGWTGGDRDNHAAQSHGQYSESLLVVVYNEYQVDQGWEEKDDKGVSVIMYLHT